MTIALASANQRSRQAAVVRPCVRTHASCDLQGRDARLEHDLDNLGIRIDVNGFDELETGIPPFGLQALSLGNSTARRHDDETKHHAAQTFGHNKLHTARSSSIPISSSSPSAVTAPGSGPAGAGLTTPGIHEGGSLAGNESESTSSIHVGEPITIPPVFLRALHSKPRSRQPSREYLRLRCLELRRRKRDVAGLSL